MSQDANPDRAHVLVVGAGPTGLLLAAELQRRGVQCNLIEALSGPLHWDRATVVHPRSLELFESLGLVEKFLEAGTRQRGVKVHSAGQLLGSMDMATCGSIYGFNLCMSEEITESILTEYLYSQGGKVNRSSRLIGLTPHARGVRAEIEREGMRYHLDADWVVGCDGIHSPTRELSGIGFEGHDIVKPWAVFDVTLQGWGNTFDTIFVYLDTLPVILTVLPGRRWRVYLRPSSAESDLVADAAATIRIYEPTVTFVDVENPTRFQCHTKVASRFRSGRVLLAGDAAHLCSPAQGHGMNSGLQDASNLAWKLALVCKGDAAPALLDSYESERRPIAEMITQSGDAVEQAQSITDPAEREIRDRAMRAELAEARGRRHEVVAEAELNVEYPRSPIVIGDASTMLAPGQRLPDAIEIETHGKSRRLHELTHRAGHTLLLIGGVATQARELEKVFSDIQELIIDSTLIEAAFAFTSREGLPDRIRRIAREAAEMLGVERITLFAVRPDGYVGMRSDRDHADALERYRALIQTGRC